MENTTMKSFMMDMWTGMNDIPTGKLFKDYTLSNSMDAKEISSQFLALQKNTVDYIFNATRLNQEQVQKTVAPLLEQVFGIPDGWSDMFKKNQEQIKESVEKSFAMAESYLSPDRVGEKKSKQEKKQTKPTEVKETAA